MKYDVNKQLLSTQQLEQPNNGCLNDKHIIMIAILDDGSGCYYLISLVLQCLF